MLIVIIHYFIYSALSDFYNYIYTYKTFTILGTNILKESSLYSIKASCSSLCNIGLNVY